MNLIVRRNGDYVALCDSCEAKLEAVGSANEAIGAMVQAGWASARENGWIRNYCPSCAALFQAKVYPKTIKKTMEVSDEFTN